MLRSPLRLRVDRFFGISSRERTRRPRGVTSEFVRNVERLEGRALLATVTVHVVNNAFSPNTVTVHPGDTVRWVFDQGVHDTVSVAGQSESWQSAIQTTTGGTFEHKFNNVGSFAYFCSLHGFDQGNGTASGMAGKIIVKNAVPLRSIRVAPVFAGLTPGGTQQFTATGVFSDGSTENITNQVTWTTTNRAVATISATGKATAVSKGFGVVIARMNGAAGVGVVFVQAPAPTLVSAQRVTSGAGRRLKVVGVDLKFSSALNLPVAQFAGHYQINQATGLPVPVLSAQYNPLTTTVRLTIGGVKANAPLNVRATGLLGASGTPVAPIATTV